MTDARISRPRLPGTPGKQVHTCVGVYADGDMAVNYVADGDLAANIEYNAAMRPGRYYFVDGEYACGGILRGDRKRAKIQELTELLAARRVPDSDVPSRPYR